MTTFASTWVPGGAYEGVPGDNEDISNGANEIRNFKVNARQRLGVDHSFIGDAQDGKHVVLQMRVQTVDPTVDPAEPTDGLFYTKAVTGHTELFYKDSVGNVVQLTNAGVVNGPIPAGTVMLFIAGTAPAGWTQSASYNDQVLRVVSGAGGGTGGSWTLSGVTVGVAVATHTLSTTELPAHTHQVNVDHGTGGAATVWSLQNVTALAGASTYTTDNGTGGGGAHGHAGSTASFSNDGTWRPSYVNCIACSKN